MQVCGMCKHGMRTTHVTMHDTYSYNVPCECMYTQDLHMYMWTRVLCMCVTCIYICCVPASKHVHGICGVCTCRTTHTCAHAVCRCACTVPVCACVFVCGVYVHMYMCACVSVCVCVCVVKPGATWVFRHWLWQSHCLPVSCSVLTLSETEALLPEGY